MAHEHREGRRGVVQIGGTVVFHDGSKAGTVSKIIVDPNRDTMTDVVVKKGVLFADERIVPIGCIDFEENGELHLDIDKDDYKELGRFDDGMYRAPDPDYTGPPGFDASTHGMHNYQFEAVLASGGSLNSGKILGFPGGEGSRNTDPMTRPALGQGDPVLDVDGEQIGEIDTLELDPTTGEPVRLVVQQGMIFHTTSEIPVASIAQLSNKGVIVDFRKAELEAREMTPS